MKYFELFIFAIIIIIVYYIVRIVRIYIRKNK